MKPLLLCLLFFSTASAEYILPAPQKYLQEKIDVAMAVQKEALALPVENLVITWKDWYLCKQGKPKEVIPDCGPDKIPSFQIGLTETGGIVTRAVDEEGNPK